MQCTLFGCEFGRRTLDGLQAREVHMQEECLPSSGLLQCCDGFRRLCAIPTSDVDLAVVVEESLRSSKK
jgi:hypothetical protein